MLVLIKYNSDKIKCHIFIEINFSIFIFILILQNLCEQTKIFTYLF